MSKHPHVNHSASSKNHGKPKTPAHTLSPAHSKAVLECARTITSIAQPDLAANFTADIPPEPESLEKPAAYMRVLQSQLAHAKTFTAKKALGISIAKLEKTLTPKQNFWHQLQAIENQNDEKLYTPKNYQAQLERAKHYTDVYVDNLPKQQLPEEGKKALKAQFHAIIEGSAGMETSWDPITVRNDAVRRPHTGVFQTAWEFIHQSREEFRRRPAMEIALNEEKNKQDLQILDLGSDLKTTEGLPTTSFAGQGAAFAGMAVASYERFLSNGGQFKDFNGIVVYEDHMTGAAGASRFRNKLEGPQHKGDSGIAEATYSGNYLITAHPFAGLNDLNPGRLTHSEATAHDVYGMLRDKFINARNKLDATPGMAKDRVKEFEAAFMPEWKTNEVLKNNDIARVIYQHDTGHELRAEAKDYGLKLAMKHYDAQHKTHITLELAHVLGLHAPEHPSAAQKQEACSILLKPITPFNPRPSAVRR